MSLAGLAWQPPYSTAGVSAALVNEVRSLRRERDELLELVRMQEADLSPRSRGQGPGSGGRARSLERHLDLERLWAAQEATVTTHPSLIVPLMGTPPMTPRWTEPILSPRTRYEGASCRAASSGALSARRRAPSAGNLPKVCNLPRGSGRRGPGHPEGAGSGPRKSGVAVTEPPRFPKAPPASETMTPRRAKQAPSPRKSGLEDALSEALRGLGGARGALSDASRQLSQEAHRRHSEAWRLQRLEQLMAASLGGFSRELRSLRAEAARCRGEVRCACRKI
jgi:hypothetical protein